MRKAIVIATLPLIVLIAAGCTVRPGTSIKSDELRVQDRINLYALNYRDEDAAGVARQFTYPATVDGTVFNTEEELRGYMVFVFGQIDDIHAVSFDVLHYELTESGISNVVTAKAMASVNITIDKTEGGVRSDTTNSYTFRFEHVDAQWRIRSITEQV